MDRTVKKLSRNILDRVEMVKAKRSCDPSMPPGVEGLDD